MISEQFAAKLTVSHSNIRIPGLIVIQSPIIKSQPN